jgi:hypothetical protein
MRGCLSWPLERFQAKWTPVRVKKTRHIKNLEPRFDSIEAEKALEPRTNQHQIRRAGRQQRDGERDMNFHAGGFEGRCHHGKNIRRFYPGSLARYFLPDSGLVYDSGTQGPDWPPAGSRRKIFTCA